MTVAGEEGVLPPTFLAVTTTESTAEKGYPRKVAELLVLEVGVAEEVTESRVTVYVYVVAP